MKKILGIMVLSLLFSGGASAESVVGKKLLCKSIFDDIEYGIHINRPKTLLKYSSPGFYEGITEKELKKVNISKFEYNPSPKTIFFWKSYTSSTMYALNRGNLEIELQNLDRSTKLIGQCQIMENSFNIKFYFQEKTDEQFKEIIKNRKL